MPELSARAPGPHVRGEEERIMSAGEGVVQLKPGEDFTVGSRGRCEIPVDSEKKMDAIRLGGLLAQKLGKRADAGGFEGFSVNLAITEVLSDAIEYGGGNRITVGWDFEGADASVTVRNRGSSVFYPGQHLGRTPKQIEDDLTQTQYAAHPHLGMALVASNTESLRYEWGLTGGDRVVAVLKYYPQTSPIVKPGDQSEVAFLSYRVGSDNSISDFDLKGMHERGELADAGGKRRIIAEHLTIAMQFRKEGA